MHGNRRASRATRASWLPNNVAPASGGFVYGKRLNDDVTASNKAHRWRFPRSPIAPLLRSDVLKPSKRRIGRERERPGVDDIGRYLGDECGIDVFQCTFRRHGRSAMMTGCGSMMRDPPGCRSAAPLAILRDDCRAHRGSARSARRDGVRRAFDEIVEIGKRQASR